MKRIHTGMAGYLSDREVRRGDREERKTLDEKERRLAEIWLLIFLVACFEIALIIALM